MTDFGSISTGTLRTEDLINAFSAELDYLNDRLDIPCEEVARLVQDAENIEDFNTEDAQWVLDALVDALNDFAPPYGYFGANKGDGANFGFWPCHEVLEELPRVDNGDEAAELGEDCISVNDHGNVTLYDGTGNVVWAIV